MGLAQRGGNAEVVADLKAQDRVGGATTDEILTAIHEARRDATSSALSSGTSNRSAVPGVHGTPVEVHGGAFS